MVFISIACSIGGEWKWIYNSKYTLKNICRCFGFSVLSRHNEINRVPFHLLFICVFFSFVVSLSHFFCALLSIVSKKANPYPIFIRITKLFIIKSKISSLFCIVCSLVRTERNVCLESRKNLVHREEGKKRLDMAKCIEFKLLDFIFLIIGKMLICMAIVYKLFSLNCIRKCIQIIKYIYLYRYECIVRTL